LMNPVWFRREHISYTGSWSLKVSISDCHSKRLYCQYLEKGKEIVNETLIIYMK
jgi:hypothetical protein